MQCHKYENYLTMKGNEMSEKKHSEVCQVAGCVGHITVQFDCHEKGNTDLPKCRYHARAHFKGTDEMLELAGKEIVRRLQAKYGRSGTFPKDRTVDVDANGKYEKTIADRKAEFDAMTPAQQEAQRKMLQDLLTAYSK